MLTLAEGCHLLRNILWAGVPRTNTARILRTYVTLSKNNYAFQNQLRHVQRLAPFHLNRHSGNHHDAKCLHSSKAESRDCLFYTKSHEYLRHSPGTGTSRVAKVGVSEYAAEELGEVVFVESLIEEGDDGVFVEEGEPVCTIEAVKSVAEIYAPVSGKVLRFNPKLKDNPGAINLDPEGEGWIFEMDLGSEEDPNHPEDSILLDNRVSSRLLDWKAYASYVISERSRVGGS